MGLGWAPKSTDSVYIPCHAEVTAGHGLKRLPHEFEDRVWELSRKEGLFESKSRPCSLIHDGDAVLMAL
jgi:hypothetical protein